MPPKVPRPETHSGLVHHQSLEEGKLFEELVLIWGSLRELAPESLPKEALRLRIETHFPRDAHFGQRKGRIQATALLVFLDQKRGRACAEVPFLRIEKGTLAVTLRRLGTKALLDYLDQTCDFLAEALDLADLGPARTDP